MKLKTLLSAAILSLVTASASAQAVDAKDYFDGKAWGFAAVADENGTAYQMDGGLRAAQPKVVVMKAKGTGEDDGYAIQNAIKTNDIVILDGSNGEFIIEKSFSIDGYKNKTLVGRNNARLCTKFFLTPEDIAYLKAQKLEGLSSTDQYTGTLPNGTSMTCDKRAFFTKKAMMELQHQKTGEYSLPDKSGIISIKNNAENIIIRNLTLVGPGAVDIDGSDLITNQESTHVWIDHCTFIDSQDGALDSKRCDWSTYTWNKFLYTERSYSHAYTNGCGWAEGEMILHLTWAFNEWSEGCMRRLPQCGDCYVHLVNNYHNCPGNSAAMTINDNCKALVEYNYAAAGVKDPLSGSGSGRYINAHDNSFFYNLKKSEVTVPYIYDAAIVKDNSKVPSIVTAQHGAGATIDDCYMHGDFNDFYCLTAEEMNINVGMEASVPLKNIFGIAVAYESSDPAKVTVDKDGKMKAVAEGTAIIKVTVTDKEYNGKELSLTVNAKAGGQYVTVRKWDFNERSAETEANCVAAGWTVGSANIIIDEQTVPTTSYTINYAPNNQEIEEIVEAKGLKFTLGKNAAHVVSYVNALRVNKPFALEIPDCKAGEKILINFKSANAKESRGFETGTNITKGDLMTIAPATVETMVIADGSVVLSSSTGGIWIYSIEIQSNDPAGVSETKAAVVPAKAAVFYNLAGQKVSAKAKGIVISNGKKFINK